MAPAKEKIIEQLRKDILPMQGYGSRRNGSISDLELGPIKESFPGASFPLAAIHEFFCMKGEDVVASSGFIAGILSPLMQKGGVCLWISNSRKIFPIGLKTFGINPDQVIFVELQKEKDILWTMEEALKCEGLTAVMGEIKDLNFNTSRRFQLAADKSRVTGFILRLNPRIVNTTACFTRWKISSLPSLLPDDMPGVGFIRWNAELLKVRNGKPGSWSIEWFEGRFRHIPVNEIIPFHQQKKTG